MSNNQNNKKDASNSPSTETNDTTKNEKSMGFLHLVLTAFGAAIGVQSSKNLQKDFSQNSPLPFIAAGIIFTVVFLTCVILVVKLVLSDV